MSPQDLIVRCIARREGELYVAVCIDFTLAAQGATLQEAKDKLHAQIQSCVRDAFTVDREHATALLTRKAPIWDRVLFKAWQLTKWLRSHRREVAYEEALRMAPACA